MNERMTISILFPILAVITIAVFAGGLGVIFMVLYSTPLEKWAVVALGLILLIGVPSTTALLQWRLEKQ